MLIASVICSSNEDKTAERMYGSRSCRRRNLHLFCFLIYHDSNFARMTATPYPYPRSVWSELANGKREKSESHGFFLLQFPASFLSSLRFSYGSLSPYPCMSHLITFSQWCKHLRVYPKNRSVCFFAFVTAYLAIFIFLVFDSRALVFGVHVSRASPISDQCDQVVRHKVWSPFPLSFSPFFLSSLSFSLSLVHLVVSFRHTNLYCSQGFSDNTT